MCGWGSAKESDQSRDYRMKWENMETRRCDCSAICINMVNVPTTNSYGPPDTPLQLHHPVIANLIQFQVFSENNYQLTVCNWFTVYESTQNNNKTADGFIRNRANWLNPWNDLRLVVVVFYWQLGEGLSPRCDVLFLFRVVSWLFWFGQKSMVARCFKNVLCTSQRFLNSRSFKTCNHQKDSWSRSQWDRLEHLHITITHYLRMRNELLFVGPIWLHIP